MKAFLRSGIMILAASFALSTLVFAGGSPHKGNLVVADPIQVNGKQIPAGDYTVTWDGDGPNVNLRILRGSKEVATAPATVKQLNAKAPEDAAETRTAGAGARELTAIRFGGKSYQLDLGSSQAEAKSGDSVK